MDFERRSMQTDASTSISYLDSGGDGRAVVILHGLAGSTSEFIATATALPEFRTILIDQRGHGHSTRVPRDTSREAYVGDVIAVVDSLGIAPVILIGQSMGAHTAMLVAAERPELIDRLVLLEGGEGSGTAQERTALGEFFRSWPVPFASRDAARAFLGTGPLASAWVVDLEERDDGLHPRFDPEVMVDTMAAVSVPRWREWEGITTPTLIVYAQNGLFTEEQKSEFTRRGRAAVRADLAGASHDAHLDAFEGWMGVLRDFLDTPEPGAT